MSTVAGGRARPAAVAGRFYPADPTELAARVDDDLRAGTARPPGPTPPKALVAPHAGYLYSGPIAGSAYATLGAVRSTVTRVVVLGPAHFEPVNGVVTSSATAFLTPLGPVPVDDEARRVALGAGVTVDDAAHAPEHSIEVHLPFLQRALDRFTLLPLLAGRPADETVAAVLEAVWGGPETLVVVSTDLSHYLDHAVAQRADARTAAAIVAGDAEAIGVTDACGAAGVRGLLLAARPHRLAAHLLDLRTSGDTAGPRDRVVGYGAFALTEVAA